VVRQTFLDYKKKLIIPYTTVTSIFLFNTLHANAATPQFLEGAGLLGGNDNGFLSQWQLIGKTLVGIIKFFGNLQNSVSHYSVVLLSKLYEFLTDYVLCTPLFIFNNSYLKDTTLTFSIISILIVTILSMINGIKVMIQSKKNKSDTLLDDVWKTSKRYFLAVTGAGFAPFAFEKSFQLINILAKGITKIGQGTVSNFDLLSHTMLSGLDTVFVCAFDIVIIALLIPIALQTGRRWWDLLCLSSLTPLALSATVFDEYKHYFNMWWNSIKKLAQTQLIISIYICLMGIFIFGTANVVSGGGLLIKLLVIIGGLFRVANPPNFIKSKMDRGDDMIDSGKGMFNTFKKVRDIVTFKGIRSLKLNKKLFKK
jgi:hypothetical protein